MMNFTVLISTRSQCKALDVTLKSLISLEIPKSCALRFLIIDNGSADNTPELLRRYAHDLPLTVIREERPGLSVARNTGVAALTGDIVLCTDDDAIVPSGWLANYAAAFRARPDVSFMGGDVVPVLNGADPAWARAALKAAPSCFARFSVGTRDVEIGPDTPQRLLPFGVNMAFRVEALKHFRFDESLGRQPGGLTLSGEETALMADMVRAGHKGLLLAGNPVEHHIHPSRQTIGYVRDYYFAQGWQAGKRLMTGGNNSPALAKAMAKSVAAAAGSLSRAGPRSATGIWLERQHSHFSGRFKALSDAD
jgi:hypothetical protein